MLGKFHQQIKDELAVIQEAGLFKKERVITGPQGADVNVEDGGDVVIMCANNYLGLANNPEIIEAAKATLILWPTGASCPNKQRSSVKGIGQSVVRCNMLPSLLAKIAIKCWRRPSEKHDRSIQTMFQKTLFPPVK